MTHSTHRRQTTTLRLAAFVPLLLLASCAQLYPGNSVRVDLDEFTVDVQPANAPAGPITFAVYNVGDEVHEFLVIRTDLAPGALPTEPDGSYEENGPGTELIDGIENILPGRTVTLTLDLEAGNYVLICNRVTIEGGGELMAHYELGMHAGFQVQ